ncbi:DUF3040 domain-containing protein [Arthrobacter sp. H14]|uniref:DUF3040 domain-containing protein n=1 Tax=Arthrobacter sp. H14 TaxID=1312959 RepID=UPI0004B0613C
MPLSEEERRRLAQLELQLIKDDPKLAKELESATAHQQSRIDTSACKLILLAGVLLILVGTTGQLPFIGATGFLLLGAGAYCLFRKKGARKRNR